MYLWPFNSSCSLRSAFATQVHGLVEQFDHMEAVEGYLRRREGFLDPGDEGGRQVDAGLFDLPLVHALVFQVFLDAAQGFRGLMPSVTWMTAALGPASTPKVT